MPRVRGQSLDGRADRAGLLYAAGNHPIERGAEGTCSPSPAQPNQA